ncbi:DUF2911 domain-containing protein [Lewinella cohaerens]|uniref:DUF2911 domain-containing protein n=1 Tax=Lewinella cohaerens TaxID=70995 RepID=UPI00037CBD58|nr:DUF2911 domain-containing protein [Lewinella cohaerens]
MKKLLLNVFALVLTVSSFAQISTPAASPGAQITQAVGLTEIMVDYSRPAMKGRTIFAADGLVPFGKIWRTGANGATKITLGQDAKVGGVAVEAGDYAVLTIPTADEWTFMMYPYEGRSWNSYTEKEAAAKFMVPTAKTAMSVESFTIGVNNVIGNSATIDFMWANTMVSVPVEVEVHELVMANIKRTMAGPSTNDYYAAASYLHDNGGDNALALEYIQKATAGDKPGFWMVRRESLILADLNRTQEAIAAAKRSLALAKEAGNDDYVRMNEKSIAEWTNK